MIALLNNVCIMLYYSGEQRPWRGFESVLANTFFQYCTSRTVTKANPLLFWVRSAIDLTEHDTFRTVYNVHLFHAQVFRKCNGRAKKIKRSCQPLEKRAIFLKLNQAFKFYQKHNKHAPVFITWLIFNPRDISSFKIVPMVQSILYSLHPNSFVTTLVLKRCCETKSARSRSRDHLMLRIVEPSTEID